MAAAGVADRPAAGRQRHQGDAGAAETSRSAAADQQEDGGRRTGYLHHVYRPQHSTGPGSACTLILNNVNTRLFVCFLILTHLCRQIVKVLTLYTPVIEFEERVSHAFITTIKVSHRRGTFMFCLVLCLTLFSFFFRPLLEHFKRQRRVIGLDDGREEDLLHHHRLHALLCRSGGAPDPGQPQSELPDPHLDLGSP